MSEVDFLCTNTTIPNMIDTLLYNHREKKAHPDWLSLNGLICFCGEQGSGKTLSAVQYVHNVCRRFPKLKVVSNCDFYFDDCKNKFYEYKGIEQMIHFDNKQYGVLFFIDEMHIEFNSLESKGMDSNIFELVSQQRKRRVHIVGTSQVFSRLAKPFREQFKYAVLCDKYFGCLFRQEVFKATNAAFEDDIRTELRSVSTRWFFASPEMFNEYDTSQVVRRVNNGFTSVGNVRNGSTGRNSVRNNMADRNVDR